MDSEGWIDIAMIASFNRIKSLTPDVPTVCEVMLLSSLLEVREDKVRLAGAEAKRWVLPDAKPSPWAADATSPTSSSSPHLHPHDPVFGVEEFPPAPRFVAADVENALMKSSGVSNVSVSVPPSSSASVTNSGDGVDDSMVKMNTPATSMSGDNEGEEALKIELK
jgi:la-related protein 1